MKCLQVVKTTILKRIGRKATRDFSFSSSKVFETRRTIIPRFEVTMSSKRVDHIRFQSDLRKSASSIRSRASVSSNTTFQGFSETSIDVSDPVQLSKGIFFQGLQNVIPSRLIISQVKLQGSLLKLENEEHTTVDLSQYNKKYVVGFGKACLPMAESLLLVLNGMIDRCIISVPVGTRKTNDSSIEVHLGAKDNFPDAASFEASKAIVELARTCTKNDLLIVLISGGGSALLPYPIPPITLEEKTDFIKKLSRAGCTISELNTIRKRISLTKGGGLVEICEAGKMIGLIISDVAGSPMDIIASGPTVENFDHPNAALDIIKRLGLEDSIPSSLRLVLNTTPTVGGRDHFARVTNFIIGDNKIALETAASAATKYGLRPYIITTELFGEASQVGYDIANLAEAFAYCVNRPQQNITVDENEKRHVVKPHLETIKNIFKKYKWPTSGILPEVFEEQRIGSKGICLLFGGETIVTVQGGGVGGRNQELVLSAGIRLDLSRNLAHVKDKVAILSAGTDGFDGPNAAAGAVIDGSAIHNAQLQGYSPMTHLKDNNSFNFFHSIAQGKYHIVCGHTETNVMDLVIIVIMKKPPK